jgi:hypothetical protein
VRIILGAAATLWLSFYLAALLHPSPTRRNACLATTLFITYGLHAVLKTLAALEATRVLNAERRSGALELLLVTPLAVDKILRGHWQAFRRRFVVPVILAALANAALIWLIAVRNPVGMPREARFTFSLILLGGGALLFTDFLALGWVGMKEALLRKHHHWAALATFGWVMLPTLAGVSTAFLLAWSGNVGPDSMRGMLILWFVFGAGYAIAQAQASKHRLASGLRNLAAG